MKTVYAGPGPIRAVPLSDAQRVELRDELQAELRRVSPGSGPRAEARMLQLLDALSRLRTGVYGLCIGCRNPIPFARLAAIPETRHCVQCAGAA